MPSGVCQGQGSLFEVLFSLCVCVCVVVWGRKGVGARPRPDYRESWPADLAACPSPHQQSERWVQVWPEFSLQLWAAWVGESDGDKMTPALILSVFLTRLPSASLPVSEWDNAVVQVFHSLFAWPSCHDITLQAEKPSGWQLKTCLLQISVEPPLCYIIRADI